MKNVEKVNRLHTKRRMKVVKEQKCEKREGDEEWGGGGEKEREPTGQEGEAKILKSTVPNTRLNSLAE